MKKIMRYASSFLVPILVCLGLPFLILYLGRARTGAAIVPSPALALPGGILVALGLVFALVSFRLIMRIGEGTIMPWDPTKKLVVAGLYRFVRNPMILSVLIILLGEAILFGSDDIYVLAAVFFIVNTLYFRFSEEPGLERRFGEEYLEYKRNVPRWLPRVSPWRPEGGGPRR